MLGLAPMRAVGGMTLNIRADPRLPRIAAVSTGIVAPKLDTVRFLRIV